MDKTIETKFFEAFKWGGVVDKCIDWMRYTYNLPPMNPRASTKEREETPEQRKAKEKWDKYYRETLPKEILEATEAFDDSVIMYMDSPLMDEIEANLNDCQTDAQRENYLFSLLKPFGESPSGCGIAKIYTPIAEINQLNEAIRGCERDKAFWQTMPEGEQIKNVNGEPSGTPKEQIEACNSMIARYKEQIEWVLNVNHQFIDLTCTDKDKVGSVERCLSAFVGVTVIFANRLDALLLTYGIDLMRLQKESGLYLKDHRQITDVDSYIGSMELAQKYMDALPKEPQQEQTTPEPQKELKDILPEHLKTDEAVKIFQRAIDAKMIEKTDTGLKWLKTKALLAYFLGHWLKDGVFPETEYDKLFGESRLGKAYSQLMNNKCGDGKPKGFEEIDKLFKEQP